MLKQHLKRVGEHFPKHIINAETHLLRKKIEQGIATAFDQAIEGSTFTHKYAELINLSSRAIGEHGCEYLLCSLCPPDHGLMLKHQKSSAGVLVTRDAPVTTLLDSFVPLPLNLQKLPPAGPRLILDLTRRQVGMWDRAAGLVPDSKIPALVHYIKGGKVNVRGIVAADGGVMAIFGVEAHDFESWRQACNRLREWFADRGIQLGRFSMHTLVPISREARGRGALLYLA